MTNAQVVRRFLMEGYEHKDYAAAMDCLSADYVDHSPANARGSAQAVDILRLVATQLSGLTVEVLDLISEGDRVAVRARFDGVHTGVMMGIPATGKRLRFEALEIFRVEGGQIAESWGYWPDREIEEKLR